MVVSWPSRDIFLLIAKLTVMSFLAQTFWPLMYLLVLGLWLTILT